MDEKKKRKRRTDEEGRTFRCSCGKSYLSYPALYTHIKNKHQGKMNTKNDNQTKNQEIVYEKPPVELQLNPIRSLIEFLSKFYPEESHHHEYISQQQEAYLNHIQEQYQMQSKDEQLKQNELYTTSIDLVFAKFIKQIQPQANLPIKHYILDFIFKLYTTINQLNCDPKFCNNSTAIHIPSMCNYVITEHYIKDQNAKQALRNPLLVCKTILYFCHWLYNEKYTNLSLRFNVL